MELTFSNNYLQLCADNHWVPADIKKFDLSSLWCLQSWFQDARLKNMLSVLSSIKSDDENEDVEMIELDFTPKSKK